MAEPKAVEGTTQEILAFLKSKIAGLNWLQLFALLKQIIALFAGTTPTPQAKAARYADCPHEDCCKITFDTIGVLAAAGAECCDCHPDCGK